MIGRKLAQFEITAKIGEGGMGEVYKATDTKLHREVALKFLPEYLARDETAQKRFEREARSAAAIDHPYICKIYDVVEADGKNFIAMEYVEGETLKVKMAAGRVPLKEALKISSDIASALEKAHKAGIVHRDLKPDNIMLTPEGHVKVMDFGLAKSIHREEEEITAALTREGTTLGTLTYMSPEQLKGAPVDNRSDIFSFGVLLYEMLTGVHPFRTGTQAETINSILNEHPSPISRYTEDTSDILQHTVEKMLAKDPDKRYQLIHEVRTNLQKMGERLSVSGMMIAPAEAKSTLWNSRLLGLGTIAALAVAVGAVVFFWPSPDQVEKASLEPMRSPKLITNDDLLERGVQLSPDGKHVVYSDMESWVEMDLYFKPLADGTEPLRITDLPGAELSPIWSPEGDQFAYIWVSPDGEESALYVVPAPLGGQERKVTDLAGKALNRRSNLGGNLSWSPDGRWLTVTERESDDEPWRIVRISLETGQKEPVTDPPSGIEGDLFSSFSPDGNHLAFVRKTGEGDGIWVQSLEDGETKRLTHDPNRGIGGLTWTADSSEIVFAAAGPDWIAYLYRLRVADPKPELVGGPGPNAVDPSISGNRLVYLREEGDLFARDIWRVAGPELEADGRLSQMQVLKGNPTTGEESPSISPNGDLIAYVSRQLGGAWEVWTANAEDSDRRKITSLGSHAYFPDWSPEGEQIVFADEGAKPPVIYLTDRQSGSLSFLTEGTDPCWSHDGEWIYFRSKEGLSKIPVRGGDPIVIRANGGGPRESRDGKHLYYFRKDKGAREGTIYRVLLDGGREEPIQRVPKSGLGYPWDLQGNRLYWVESGWIRFLDLETRGVTDWFKLPISKIKSLCVAPDQKWVYYAGLEREPSRDIMLIENFR